MTMARCLAKRAVKNEWRRQREHWVSCEPKELTQAADAYLAEHQAELIEKAKLRLCKENAGLICLRFFCADVMLRKDRR